MQFYRESNDMYRNTLNNELNPSHAHAHASSSSVSCITFRTYNCHLFVTSWYNNYAFSTYSHECSKCYCFITRVSYCWKTLISWLSQGMKQDCKSHKLEVNLVWCTIYIVYMISSTVRHKIMWSVTTFVLRHGSMSKTQAWVMWGHSWWTIMHWIYEIRRTL